MNDYISRKEAITQAHEIIKGYAGYKAWAIVDMLRKLPSVEPEIIRCKDCKWWGYDDETGDVRVCQAAKHGHISSHWEIIIRRTYRGDFYCADAERRTDE